MERVVLYIYMQSPTEFVTVMLQLYIRHTFYYIIYKIKG